MAKARQPLAKELEAELDKWWAEHVPNSPVSRATDAYNHLHAAFDVLKERVDAVVSGNGKSEVNSDAT